MVVDFFEIRKPITDEMIPGIVPNRYYITNHGTIWSEYIHSYIAVRINSHGYYQTTLRLTNGNSKTITIHRLVCMAFNPHPNMHNLVVNHKNGIKTCNYPDNLEWCTYKENTQHAIRTGLMCVSGENSPRAVISNDTVRSICELLEKNVSYYDIIDKLGLPESIYQTISHIRNRTGWQEVSKDYNFDNYVNLKPRPFTEEEIHKICQIFEKYGTGILSRDIMTILGR